MTACVDTTMRPYPYHQLRSSHDSTHLNSSGKKVDNIAQRLLPELAIVKSIIRTKKDEHFIRGCCYVAALIVCPPLFLAINKIEARQIESIRHINRWRKVKRLIRDEGHSLATAKRQVGLI